jgi:hypothetical protein
MFDLLNIFKKNIQIFYYVNTNAEEIFNTMWIYLFQLKIYTYFFLNSIIIFVLLSLKLFFVNVLLVRN